MADEKNVAEQPPHQSDDSDAETLAIERIRTGAAERTQDGADVLNELGIHISSGVTRITARADQMGGVPCIRELRIPVATVVGMIADGMTEQEILDAYPDLEAEDIHEALRYAA
jgi:uncharacterized protein (DUF433 family)